jgi:hypothetical protein
MAVDQDVVETIRLADIVIGVGFDPVECDKTWFAKVNTVSLDSVSMNEGDYQPLESIGEISNSLIRLTTQLKEPGPWPEEVVAARRKAVARTARLSTTRVSPLALIDVAGDDAIPRKDHAERFGIPQATPRPVLAHL